MPLRSSPSSINCPDSVVLLANLDNSGISQTLYRSKAKSSWRTCWDTGERLSVWALWPVLAIFLVTLNCSSRDPISHSSACIVKYNAIQTTLTSLPTVPSASCGACFVMNLLDRHVRDLRSMFDCAKTISSYHCPVRHCLERSQLATTCSMSGVTLSFCGYYPLKLHSPSSA